MRCFDRRKLLLSLATCEMANARTLALLTVVLLGVSVASLDAKKLLETSAQAEANILGKKTSQPNEELKIAQTTLVSFFATRSTRVCCTECGVLAR